MYSGKIAVPPGGGGIRQETMIILDTLILDVLIALISKKKLIMKYEYELRIVKNLLSTLLITHISAVNSFF
jgi:hypothetical protein